MALMSTYFDGDEVIEVGFCKYFKEASEKSNVLQFEEKSLKEFILNTNPNEVLVVVSTINSPKVVKSVRLYRDVLKEI